MFYLYILFWRRAVNNRAYILFAAAGAVFAAVGAAGAGPAVLIASLAAVICGLVFIFYEGDN